MRKHGWLSVLLIFGACSTPSSRIKRHRDVFDAAPPSIQDKIKNGEADIGMTEDQVRLALGKPERKFERKLSGAPDQEVWVYGGRGFGPGVGLGIGVFSGGGPVTTGVSVGTESGYTDERATQIVFQEGRVVSIDRPK